MLSSVKSNFLEDQPAIPLTYLPEQFYEFSDESGPIGPQKKIRMHLHNYLGLLPEQKFFGISSFQIKDE
jgi:hypothetical protein